MQKDSTNTRRTERKARAGMANNAVELQSYTGRKQTTGPQGGRKGRTVNYQSRRENELYLATGDLMASLSYLFRIGRSSTSAIIKETFEAIISSLKPIVLAKPDQTKWMDIAEAYYEQWQFPNCLGAIDGKHVLMQAPPKSRSHLHNYKGTFSIILLACVDANYKFVLVNIGAEGQNSEGGVFNFWTKP
ncbi:DDE Tnp4 domain-containing protein [Trichonephila clavipes]|nr:DDE Tnp4 domain-containing protein [Trichonephila clavipes]